MEDGLDVKEKGNKDNGLGRCCTDPGESLGGVGGCVCVRWWGVGLREADSTRFKAGWHQQKTGFEDSAPNSNALFLVSISEHPSGVRG